MIEDDIIELTTQSKNILAQGGTFLKSVYNPLIFC